MTLLQPKIVGEGLSKNCVAHWSMDGHWQDVCGSGNGNHGTPVNSPTFNTTTPMLGSASGVFVSASSQSVNCGNDTSLYVGTKDFTIYGWVKTSDSTNLQSIVMKGTASSQFRVTIRGDVANDPLQLYMLDGLAASVTITQTDFSINVTDGAKHVFCVTVNRSGNAILYIDGSEVGSGSVGVVSDVVDTASDDLIIGKHSYAATWFLNGNIDDTAMWINRVLSPSDVAMLYNYGNGFSMSRNILTPHVVGGYGV